MRHDPVFLVTFPVPHADVFAFLTDEADLETHLSLAADDVSEVALSCWRCHIPIKDRDDLLASCPGWASDRPMTRNRSRRELGLSGGPQ